MNTKTIATYYKYTLVQALDTGETWVTYTDDDGTRWTSSPLYCDDEDKVMTDPSLMSNFTLELEYE